MSLAQVRVLFRRNAYVGNNAALNIATINCNLISSYSPRPVWLVRQRDGRTPDLEYYITFAPDSVVVLDPNTLIGFWLEETSESEGMMVDILTVDALVEGCNCVDCDTPDGNLIPSRYGGGPGGFTGPTPTTYCLSRTNTLAQGGANLTLVQQVVMDYTGQLENLRLISWNSGTGVAKFQGTSYSVPAPIGTDTITSGVCS